MLSYTIRYGAQLGRTGQFAAEGITSPPKRAIKGRSTAMTRRICRAMYDVTKVRVQLGRFADPLPKLAIKGRIKCTLKYTTYEQNLELANQN